MVMKLNAACLVALIGGESLEEPVEAALRSAASIRL
jgi:hypothetical protein